jgi:hypothetical protein
MKTLEVGRVILNAPFSVRENRTRRIRDNPPYHLRPTG